MKDYARVMLGLMGLCGLGLMTLGHILRLDGLFVFATILECGIIIVIIYDDVTGEDDEEI